MSGKHESNATGPGAGTHTGTLTDTSDRATATVARSGGIMAALTRAQKAMVTGLVAVALFMGMIIGYAAAGEPASASSAGSHPTEVRAYNDGFTASKVDDCQQGSLAACNWLRDNHVPGAGHVLPKWVHWHRVPASDLGKRCIIAWGEVNGHGNTSAYICANGNAETS